MTSASVLAIDLGTSRVKVALVDEHLTVRAATSRLYATLSDEPGQAEQNVEDWIAGVFSGVTELGETVGDVVAVSLTGQMPTLVTLDHSGTVLGRAVTWQDSRADELVEAHLDEGQRRRFSEISGAPIDGRYLVPMHLRRGGNAETLLSARDYLFFWLTGEIATDPSTASGYGVYDLSTANWSSELMRALEVEPTLLPPIVDSIHYGTLLQDRLGLVRAGTPVVLGGADSVCAHHWIEHYVGAGVSIIDGSSTVILATWPAGTPRSPEVLATPLIEEGRIGVELDLLATGSSIGWLSGLLNRTPAELENLALSHPKPGDSSVLLLPYLAGGEQGALWRSDLTGTLAGLTLASSPADLALALFEGIAFETWRCLVAAGLDNLPLTILTASDSVMLRPAILAELSKASVIALRGMSPSVLGAALLGFEALAVPVEAAVPRSEELPTLGPDYATVLATRLARYFAHAPVLSAAPR